MHKLKLHTCNRTDIILWVWSITPNTDLWLWHLQVTIESPIILHTLIGKRFVSPSDTRPLNISVQQDTKWHNKSLYFYSKNGTKPNHHLYQPETLAQQYLSSSHRAPSPGAFVRLRDRLFRVQYDVRGCYGNPPRSKTSFIFPSTLLQEASKSPINILTAVITSLPFPFIRGDDSSDVPQCHNVPQFIFDTHFIWETWLCLNHQLY